MTRLRSSPFALPPPRFALRWTSRATEDKSSFGEARRGCLQGRALVTALLTVAAVVVGGGTRVLACPMCFGAEETSMLDGTKLGVLVMLAITLAVQGAFVGFFLYLRKRAKRVAEVELDTEWAELQRASRTS